jgi:phage gp29-like protein
MAARKRMAKKVELSQAPDEFGRKTHDDVPGAGKQPDPRPIIIQGLQDQRYRGFIDTLSTEAIASTLRRADMGDLAAQMSLFMQMEERDASLAAAMMTRRSAPVGLRREMMPAHAKDPAGVKIAGDIAEDTAGVVDQIENMDASLMDFFDATGKGISCLEIDWSPEYDGTVETLRHISPQLYAFDDQTGDFYLDMEGAVFLGRDQVNKKIFVKDYPYKFIMHRSKMRSGHPSRGGALRTITWCYVFRNFAMKDWSIFLEVFGMPMRIGKYKPGATERDKAILTEMLKKMASDSWAVISENTVIEFAEIVNRGQEPFSAFFNAMRSEYFLAILGQEGTNVTNKYGTKGDTAVKQMVRQDILEADCKQAEETIRRDLLFPIVMLRHGLDIARLYTPILHFRYEPPMEKELEANTDVKVLVEMGLGKRVLATSVAKKYGWEMAPAIAKPEDMLIDPTPPTPLPQVPLPSPQKLQALIDERIKMSRLD